MTPSDYITFVEDEDNGFVKNTNIDGWSYKVQYKPSAYIYLKEKRSSLPDEGEFARRASQLDKWVFFNVYVQHEKIKKGSPIRLVSNNLEDYNSFLNYYLTENKNNFRLYTATDTIYPRVYVFENSYNLSPEDVFVIAFELKSKKKVEAMTLAYNDALLKTGIVRFSFTPETLKNEPSIQF